MKNCDNCEHGSYGLDCNTGIETLYCRESEYEYEVQPSDVCESHQFIDGYIDKDELRNNLDCIIKEQKRLVKSIVKKY